MRLLQRLSDRRALLVCSPISTRGTDIPGDLVISLYICLFYTSNSQQIMKRSFADSSTRIRQYGYNYSIWFLSLGLCKVVLLSTEPGG